MPLTTEQRSEVWAAIMRAAREDPIPSTIVKADLAAAVDAADTFLDTIQSTYNAALPQPFRAEANVNQKILLLAYVLERRRQAILGN